jgi:hypothetical protein
VNIPESFWKKVTKKNRSLNSIYHKMLTNMGMLTGAMADFIKKQKAEEQQNIIF